MSIIMIFLIVLIAFAVVGGMGMNALRFRPAKAGPPVLSLEFEIPETPTSSGMPLIVQGTTQVCPRSAILPDSPAWLEFREDMQALFIREGQVALKKATWEDVYGHPDDFGAMLKEAARDALDPRGIDLLSLNITNVRDSQGLIAGIEAARSAAT